MTESPDQRDSLISADDNRQMFDRIARRYDLMNGLMSGGLDRRWRRKAVKLLTPRSGGRYLDVGCGTGDLAMEILRQCPAAEVIGIDPAEEMLAIAKAKIARKGIADRASFQPGDAESLDFADGELAGVISAFCLRNIAHRAKALAEMRRVIAPGGRAVILELTTPTNPIVRAGHWLHTRCFVPVAGRCVARGGGAYTYLVDSVRDFTQTPQVLEMMAEVGFAEPACMRLAGGVVTIFVGQVE